MSLSMHVLSMVVPLQTLPGWPVAESPSALYFLGLLLGLPIAVIILFSLIGMAGSIRSSAAKDGAAVEVDEPLWLGGPSGAAAVGNGERAALPAGSQGASAIDGLDAPQAENVGGASARW